MVLTYIDSCKAQIDRILSGYPCLKSILSNNSGRYNFATDPYGSGNSLITCDEILTDNQIIEISDEYELLIGGVIYWSEKEYDFQHLLSNLECWIRLYPVFQTKSFGKKLTGNFFNIYSEVEIFHALSECGLNPQFSQPITGSGSKAEYTVSLDNRTWIIEVITPRYSVFLNNKFKNNDYAYFANPEKGHMKHPSFTKSRAVEKIVEKIDKQIKKWAAISTNPVLLVINYRYSSLEVVPSETIFQQIIDEGCDIPDNLYGFLFYYKGRRGSVFIRNPEKSITEKEIIGFNCVLNQFSSWNVDTFS